MVGDRIVLILRIEKAKMSTPQRKGEKYLMQRYQAKREGNGGAVLLQPYVMKRQL